jgi:hypothetical protein
MTMPTNSCDPMNAVSCRYPGALPVAGSMYHGSSPATTDDEGRRNGMVCERESEREGSMRRLRRGRVGWIRRGWLVRVWWVGVGVRVCRLEAYHQNVI